MRGALAAVLLAPWVVPAAAEPGSGGPAGAGSFSLPAQSVVEVSIAVSPRGGVVVSVLVLGEGPYDFLIDTGSSHSTIAAELAERLRLAPVAQASVSTPAGAQLQPVVAVERLCLGSACAFELLPSVVDAADLRQLEPQISGVVGQDVLSRFDYTLDYARERLRFAVDEAEPGERLPLVRLGSRSLVRLAPVRGGSAMMVPDSGASALVLFQRHGRTALEVERVDATFTVGALAMRTTGAAAILRRLDLGGITLRDQPAVVVDRQDGGPGQADGLLPLRTFSRVSWSNSGGYLVLRR